MYLVRISLELRDSGASGGAAIETPTPKTPRALVILQIGGRCFVPFDEIYRIAAFVFVCHEFLASLSEWLRSPYYLMTV